MTGTNPWIERVKAADAEAEEAWSEAAKADRYSLNLRAIQTQALIAIAAELRAQRIARRPGAGQ